MSCVSYTLCCTRKLHGLRHSKTITHQGYSIIAEIVTQQEHWNFNIWKLEHKCCVFTTCRLCVTLNHTKIIRSLVFMTSAYCAYVARNKSVALMALCTWNKTLAFVASFWSWSLCVFMTTFLNLRHLKHTFVLWTGASHYTNVWPLWSQLTKVVSQNVLFADIWMKLCNKRLVL